MNRLESPHGIMPMADVGKPTPQVGRRSFMIATTACVAQPVTALSGGGSAMKTIALLINRPCSVLPGIKSKRLPEFLCRGNCKAGKYFCLEN